MLQKFCIHIDNEFSFLKDKKLLIAISGGIDSVVITHLFDQLHFSIGLAHCNFKLRGKASDGDEEFVKNLGVQLQIPVFTNSFDTTSIATNQKKSIQITARELRYIWFEKLLQKHGFDYVVTAHHADDNLETFLINLTRATGLKGFSGIPKKNKNIVRPLLTFSRDCIVDFAMQNNISWREDQSNTSTKYVRNKIRHKIIPILKEINPSLLNSFSNTVKHIEESQIIIDAKITAVKREIFQEKNISGKKYFSLSIAKISNLENPKTYLYQLLKEYHFTEWNDIVGLLTAQSGKKIHSKTHTLLKDRVTLLLYKISDFQLTDTVFQISEHQKKLTEPIHLRIEKTTQQTNEAGTIYIDKNLISFPLQIRKWQTGDVFFPLGMKGKKKLSKFFKDEKMSLLEKENTWLLCTSKNEIIWVVNRRKDRRFILSQNDTNGLKITSVQ